MSIFINNPNKLIHHLFKTSLFMIYAPWLFGLFFIKLHHLYHIMSIAISRSLSNYDYQQWTRDGFGLGDTRALIGYSRYRLVGSDDESRLKMMMVKAPTSKNRNLMKWQKRKKLWKQIWQNSILSATAMLRLVRPDLFLPHTESEIELCKTESKSKFGKK